MDGISWTHRLAKICIKPLANTSVTPNHLTTVRLVTGVAACAAFAVGNPQWDLWGGWLWLFSAFMDRADGELARLTGKTTPGGHRYDMFCDITVSSLFFIGCAIGLRDGYFGNWMILMGVTSTAGVFIAQIYAEKIDTTSVPLTFHNPSVNVIHYRVVAQHIRHDRNECLVGPHRPPAPEFFKHPGIFPPTCMHLQRVLSPNRRLCRYQVFGVTRHGHKTVFNSGPCRENRTKFV